MISVSEAKKIIVENTGKLEPVPMPLREASGLVLAADIYALTDIPAFNQSSMDGYAFLYHDWEMHNRLMIEGEIPAGTSMAIAIAPQTAIRIFTGAAVPQETDTVVMQEKVNIENGELIILDDKLQRGSNVRPKGSEIKAGELALAKDSWLTPAALGFLAGIGVAQVNAYPKPSISIIVTGNELQQPGRPLHHGQVYESNSFSLKSVLQHLQIPPVKIFWVKDDPDQMREILQEALQISDVILLTGGISVGDYDCVFRTVEACGVSKLFHRVKQRPGKPLYFGKKENRMVFGLPGNPSSVLTCFYEYVIPAIELLTGRNNIIQSMMVPLGKPYQKEIELTCFLKAYFDGKTVSPLEAQESYRMRTFATANCLIQLNEEVKNYVAGDFVEVHFLPT